jgi:metallo-beta-lactamase family protein
MEIQFLGAAREVTGSCHLITVGDRRLLVDCGLIQGSRQDEQRNRDPFPVDMRSIDAIVLTHAHLDHSGRLPLMVKQGYRGPIYTHRATVDLCSIMLRDAGYLNEKEAEWENRKRERKRLALVEPLYTRAMAEDTMEYFRPLGYGDITEILPGVKLRLLDAGHIIGSAIAELWLEEGGTVRKLVFSGDLGHRGAPILRDPVRPDEADLVVMESTYGDRRHRSWDATWEEMKGVMQEAAGSGGNVLIPAFAVGRTQELLYAFKRNYRDWAIDRWMVFLDSPMAIEATEVYEKHWRVYDAEAASMRDEHGGAFDFPNLYYTATADQSRRINRVQAGAMVIAGSGMCDGGRIKHHFKHNIWRDNCHIIIVGFQARGTLGRSLVDGARQIRLWGETVRVAATIHTIGGLSAHADQQGLLDWYGAIGGRPPVALVHGEPEPMDTLAGLLRKDHQAKVLLPEAGARMDLVSGKLHH